MFRLQLRRGFTLTELLVVIAIIIILLAILIPVVSTIQRSANRSKSVSNLRQLGGAMMSFQGDHDMKVPPMADWSWAFQSEGMLGGKAWDFYLWPYLDVPGADPSRADSPRPDLSFENLFFHPGDEAQADEQGRCRRSYALAWTPPMGIFPGYQPDGRWQGWGGPISRLVNPSRVIMLTERPGHTGNVVGEGGYADIVKPADQTAVQNIHPDGRFNYIFWDGHVETLTPLETTGATQDLNSPGGYWTADPSDDFIVES